MSPSTWRRYEHQQHQLLLATLPKAGVVEYDDRPISIRPELLTGPARRAQLTRALAALRSH